MFSDGDGTLKFKFNETTEEGPFECNFTPDTFAFECLEIPLPEKLSAEYAGQENSTIPQEPEVEEEPGNAEKTPGETINFSEADSRLSYTGELDDDNEFSGRGKLTWRNGDYYDGEWLKGQRHGSGTFVYADDAELKSYTGDWINGTMSGVGLLIKTNGEKYTGKFKDGVMIGRGTYFWPNGQYYEGNPVYRSRYRFASQYSKTK